DEEEREPHPRPPGDEVDQSAGDARAAGDQSHEEQGPVRDPLELIDALELSLVLREESQHTVAPPAPGQPERPVEFRHADESGHDDQPERDLTDAGIGRGRDDRGLRAVEDRKSTRLNSSHVSISYAVFCLKKKRHRVVRWTAVT